MWKAVKTGAPASLMLLHHFIGIYGFVIMIYFDGVGFTLQYLVLFLEASNYNNHIRILQTQFKQQGTLLYNINGLMFTIVFFVFRVCWMTYMLFTTGLIGMIPGVKSICGNAFYELIDRLSPLEKVCIRFSQGLYLVFYLLNLYWMFLLTKGLLKSFGLIAKSEP